MHACPRSPPPRSGCQTVVTIALLLTATLTAGMLGITAGTALGALICWLLVRGQFRSRTGGIRRCGDPAAAIAAILALFALTNLDIVLGTGLPRRQTRRANMRSASSSRRSSTATPIRRGHGIRPDGRCRRGRTTLVDLGVVAGIGAICAVHLGVPDLVVSIIAGPEYAQMADLLPLFALIGACGALLQFGGERTGRHPRPQPDPGDLGGMRDAHRPRGGLAQQCRAGGGHHAGGRRHRGRGGYGA